MALENFLVVDPNGRSKPHDMAAVINSMRAGKLNNGFLGTLAANAASTTFVAATTLGVERVGPNSFILPMALTDNAADAMLQTGVDSLRVTARANGSVTFQHANNAQVDRSFQFIVFN